MADSEKTEHLTTSKMELFCARVLDEAELHSIALHLSNCAYCGQQFVATLGRQKAGTTVSFTLAPEFWLRHEHLDYEQLVEFTENKPDAPDRELIDIHLETCAPCREDIQSFLAFRKQIAPEMKVSYAPVVLEPTTEKLTWWNPLSGLAWKPIYAAAVVLIAIALLIGVLYLKRRSHNFQAQHSRTPSVKPAAPSQTPTPYSRATNDPPAPAKESPTEKPNSAVAVVTLNDGGGVVTVDAGGNVSGLDQVPASRRDEIAQALLTERIARPSILKELGGEDSSLRGSDNRQSFKLISPARTVLISDRPTFKWDKLLGANTYRVYVNDREGDLVATSEVLTSERTEWRVTKSLNRGKIYAWTVVAAVDGKEIVAPGPSASEIRFSILSSNSLQQLNKLRATRSHLALGVFFAQHGMISEAKREFEIVIRNNPGAASAKRLLGQIQTWESH